MPARSMAGDRARIRALRKAGVIALRCRVQSGPCAVRMASPRAERRIRCVTGDLRQASTSSSSTALISSGPDSVWMVTPRNGPETRVSWKLTSASDSTGLCRITFAKATRPSGPDWRAGIGGTNRSPPVTAVTPPQMPHGTIQTQFQTREFIDPVNGLTRLKQSRGHRGV